MPRYFILGPSASVFWDPTSRLKVVSKDESNPDALHGNMTKRIELALKQNHIQEVKSFKPKKAEASDSSDAEVKEPKSKKPAPAPVASAKGDLTKMTRDQLIVYYKEEYETTAEDIKNFSALKLKDMVEFLQDEETVN